MRRWNVDRCLRRALAAAAMMWAQSALAQSPQPLNHFVSGDELVGRPPELFSYLRDDLYTVVDPLDSSVVIINQAGAIAGRSEPLPFAPANVRDTGAALVFEEASGQRRAVLSRTVNPAQVGALAIEEGNGALAPAVAPPARVRRANARTLRLDVGGRTLTVRARAGGYLSDAKVLGRDASGHWYVQSSEVVEGSPQIRTLVFVQRFLPSARLKDVAAVPVADMDTVPSSMVALSADGLVTAIVPTATGVFLQKLGFESISARRDLRPAVAPARTPIQTTVHQTSGLADEPADVEAAAVTPPATRDEIVSRAQAFLAINWTMTESNFTRIGIENRCAKTEGKYWLRPSRFTRASIGRTFGPMPYHWGGGDSPETFRAKLSRGLLAGNICTCREAQYNQCQVSEAAGVDCSGFVSRTWGVTKHGTSNLHRVAAPVPSLGQLKRGDALNRPGSHVRLFVGFGPGPALTFEVIESATNRDCEGVCRKTYTAAQLNGYRPMRYVGIRD